MSDVYIQRLRQIQTEQAATRMALAYVGRNWHTHSIYQEAELLTPGNFALAARHAESTYYIRLYAEFEGILKDHLKTNFSHVSVPDKPKVDWLISRVLQTEEMTIEPPLRLKMDAVRNYRNLIAHRHARPVLFVTFDDALSILNTFLARLPDPLS